MTKKDYELIAKAISGTLFNYQITQALVMLRGAEQAGYDIAKYLEQANPKFNRSKFLKACGLEG